MSTEYMWGAHRGKIGRVNARKMDAIARRVGGPACGFVSTTIPGDGPMAWFYGPNRGAPWDRELAHDVATDVAAAGLIYPPLPARAGK